MKKGLIYGFGPYLHFSENITQQLLESLSANKRYSKKVFDVRFDRKMFEAVLEKEKPAWVLGMGQHRRARKIHIERCARNWMIGEGFPKGKEIRRGGPEKLWATLPVEKTEETTITYNAGSYVCNYSMWVVGEWCEKKGVPFGFLHVPKFCPLGTAKRVLKEVVDRLE